MNLTTWRARKSRTRSALALLDAFESVLNTGVPRTVGDVQMERIGDDGRTRTERLLIRVDQELADLQNAQYERDQAGREERP